MDINQDGLSSSPLPSPPLLRLAGATLFLDFDGTLVELVERPDAVTADPALRDLLARLGNALDGRLAIVSGRSLAQLDDMLGPVAEALILVGSHGMERRQGGVTMRPDRPASLDHVAEALHGFATGRPGVLVETKSFGVALHYRLAPACEASARDMAAGLAERYGLKIQHGHMMVELRVPGDDKGSAIRRLMAEPPLSGTQPFFFGDDLTDEPGLEAVESLGGAGVLVGRARPTAARYGLPGVPAVRAWLGGLVS